MAEPEVKQRLAAILAADVAGYTRLMAADAPATIAALRGHRDLFRRHIEANEGRVVDMAGDSVLAVFTSAAGAVKAAVDAQGEVTERNEELPENRRMQFRVGVNLGDIREVEDGTVYGDGVNIAARLEGLAEPGGVMISDDAYRQVRRDPDLRFADAGEQEVKNVAEPVRAFRLITAFPAEPANAIRAPALPDKPSIAVLAFDNRSGDPDQAYFADGIAEDLITALSRIRWLFVTARNSSFTYKGRAADVKQVGRELGVRYVVEGSVRRAGQRVRITAQLIDAVNGNHLWAQRYDRELEDIFAVQDEITDTIVAAIEPELGAAERERAMRRPPDSLEAWGLYQRGVEHMYRFTATDSAEAKRLFKAAAERDPRFAAPLGALAYALYLEVILAVAPAPEETTASAIEAGRAAVARDDKDPMAHFGLGRALTVARLQMEAIRELEIAIELNPNFALAHLGLGVALIGASRLQEAIESLDKAIRLSPHDPILWTMENARAMAKVSLGAFAEGLADARLACRHPNTGVWSYVTLISALGHLGRTEEAQDAIAQAHKQWPAFSLPDFLPRLPFDLRAVGGWLDGLRKAGLEVPESLR
jgi:TolB-like protein/Flp pilus assembly protein TadD